MSKKGKKQRKQKKRQERLRQQRHQQKSQPKERNDDYYDYEPPFEAGDEFDPAYDVPSTPAKHMGAVGGFAMERHFRDIHKALEGKDFENIDDLNAHLQTLMASGELGTHRGELSNQERAQELAYQAMEEEGQKESAWRARQALDLDPDCVDALATLALSEADSLEDYIEGLEKAVAAGVRSLGEEFFKENKGHFWGITETRPYMRARQTLAEHLTYAGRHEEAVKHYAEMMELNPNDNQGLRFSLLASYLIVHDLDGAKKLLEQFDEYPETMMLWGKVLREFLAGDIKAAAQALKAARKENKYVEAFLSGRKAIPDASPAAGYSPGHMSEAEACACVLGPAWSENPKAVAWLEAGGMATEMRIVK